MCAKFVRTGLRNTSVSSCSGGHKTLGVSLLLEVQGLAWLQRREGEIRIILSSYSQSSFTSTCVVVHSARGLLAELPLHGWCKINALSGLSHYLDAVACITEQRHVSRVPRIVELLHRFEKSLLARMVTINQAWLQWLPDQRWGCEDSLWRLLHRRGVTNFCLALIPASSGPSGRRR